MVARLGSEVTMARFCGACGAAVPDGAQFCPACGASADGSKAAAGAASRGDQVKGCVGLAAVVLVIVLALAMCGQDDKPAADAPRPTLRVTAEELLQGYEANEAAAQQRFAGKRLLVSGTVSSIDLDFSDDPVVRLATSNEFEQVAANLADDAKAPAATLRKGQEVTLACESVSEVLGTPILSGCRLGG
jgi:hypothetical protein